MKNECKRKKNSFPKLLPNTKIKIFLAVRGKLAFNFFASQHKQQNIFVCRKDTGENRLNTGNAACLTGLVVVLQKKSPPVGEGFEFHKSSYFLRRSRAGYFAAAVLGASIAATAVATEAGIGA
jgi:hypothetical protein